MFFFVAGLSPAVRNVGLSTCRRCGEEAERRQVIGTTLYLFFLPVFSWRKKAIETVLACRSCGLIEAESEQSSVYCGHCQAQRFESSFLYCPYCGTPYPSSSSSTKTTNSKRRKQ